MNALTTLPHLLTLERPPCTCAEVHLALPLFVTDEMAGLPVDQQYPDIALHLLLCPACAEAAWAVSAALCE